MRPFLLLVLALAGCLSPAAPPGGTGPFAATEPPTSTAPSDAAPEGWTWDGLLPGKSCVPNAPGGCLVVTYPTSPAADHLRGTNGWAGFAGTLRLEVAWDARAPQQEVLEVSVLAVRGESGPHAIVRGVLREDVRSPYAVEVPVLLDENETHLYVQVSFDHPGPDTVRSFAYLDQPFHARLGVVPA